MSLAAQRNKMHPERGRPLVFFTGNRSEFGLLEPVIRSVRSDFDIKVIASGTHLNLDQGRSLDEVRTNIPPEELIVIGGEADYQSRLGPSKWIESTVGALSSELARLDPLALVVLGDRLEAFVGATAGFLLGIPIVHMGGGNITGGELWDDSLRFGISSLAHLHLVTCKTNRMNLLKTGIEGWRVHVTGNPIVQRVKDGDYASFDELAAALKADSTLEKGFVLFTYHPDSNNRAQVDSNINICLDALEASGKQVIITGPNGDPHSSVIQEAIEKRVASNSRLFFKYQLGVMLYVSAMENCSMVAGNSSSALNETPVFAKPAIDIGSRQENRHSGTNVLRCPIDKELILNAMNNVETLDFRRILAESTNPFDQGASGDLIREILKKELNDPVRLLKKNIVWDEEPS